MHHTPRLIRTLTAAGTMRPSCPTASYGRRIGPTEYPDNPMELDNFAMLYADEQPVSVPMFELDMMAAKMPMRSTHGSLDPKGPHVYQTTCL